MVPLNWRGDVLLGLLAMIVVSIGIWHVGVWLDEAATAHIIGYPTWDMVQLWRGVGYGQYPDGVDMGLAPYYLVMHQWVRLVGITPITLRIPSVIAAGIGTMAMAAVGRHLVGRKGQLAYAACFALLPRTTAMALEARPYGPSAMFVALAALLLVKIWEHPRWWMWPACVLAMLGGMAMHLFTVIPLVAMSCIAFIVCRGRRRWMVAGMSVLSVVIAVPFARAVLGQSENVAMGETARAGLIDRFFVESWAATRTSNSATQAASDLMPHHVASATAVLAALMIVAVLLSTRGRGVPRLWTVIATLGLVYGVFFVVESVDVMSLGARYFSSLAPLFAVLLAEVILAMRWPVGRVLIVLFVIGCLLIFALQRRSAAKGPWADYELMGEVLSANAQPGDGFLIDPSGGWMGGYRGAIDVNPGAFEDLVDVAVHEREPLSNPWSSDSPRIVLSEQPELPATLWVASNNPNQSVYTAELVHLGYVPGDSERGLEFGHTITRWQR